MDGSPKRYTRRHFLGAGLSLTGTAVLAACQPAATPQVIEKEKVVTQVVEVTKVIKEIVKET
ncbi:MAG: hypothetical protein ACUVWR_14385, partial [Anaerolineae bacterium]